ncbi:MAG: DUF899 family protein [Candidatus Marinimicrobia bacterium]|nr:DUF899 family protein [Candidatus Neomarinimicrobiota bacterium]
MNNFTFKTRENKPIKFSDLFGNQNELILVFNMGKSCPYCTLWADGFNGMVHHLENRAGFALVSPDTPKIQNPFANSRGWKFTMVSCQNMDFFKQTGFFNGKDGCWPGIATFIRKKTGNIFRYTKSYFGPGDNYCNMWDINDLLPPLEEEWAPKYSYSKTGD